MTQPDAPTPDHEPRPQASLDNNAAEVAEHLNKVGQSREMLKTMGDDLISSTLRKGTFETRRRDIMTATEQYNPHIVSAEENALAYNLLAKFKLPRIRENLALESRFAESLTSISHEAFGELGPQPVTNNNPDLHDAVEVRTWHGQPIVIGMSNPGKDSLSHNGSGDVVLLRDGSGQWILEGVGGEMITVPPEGIVLGRDTNRIKNPGFVKTIDAWNTSEPKGEKTISRKHVTMRPTPEGMEFSDASTHGTAIYESYYAAAEDPAASAADDPKPGLIARARDALKNS